MRDDGTIQPAKITHFTQQGYQIKGVIHGGMNDGEEVYSYEDLGIRNILGFEPLEQAVQKCRELHPNVECIQVGLGDKNTSAILKVTGGDGKGSSLFDGISEHEERTKWRPEDLTYKGTQSVKLTRLDTFFEKKQTHRIADYDCLVLDTQGNEWEVLHGCGKYLREFKFLSIELSSTPVYEGEHSAQEVIDWLEKQGFTQDSEIQSHNDVFFIRSDIKPVSDRVYRGLA